MQIHFILTGFPSGLFILPLFWNIRTLCSFVNVSHFGHGMGLDCFLWQELKRIPLGSVADQKVIAVCVLLRRESLHKTALSVVQHIPEVSLNQHLLSGVIALISRALFPLSFVSVEFSASEFQLLLLKDWVPANPLILYLNTSTVGSVKLRQLWPCHPTSNWVLCLSCVGSVSLQLDAWKRWGRGGSWGQLKFRILSFSIVGVLLRRGFNNGIQGLWCW